MMRLNSLLITALLISPSLFAARLQTLSPQGEVAEIRQVVARFDEAMVAFGDPQAPAPFDIECSDPKANKGSARWQDDKRWVFDFENDLPPGVRCTVRPVNQLKSLAGNNWQGEKSYQFNTGGPFVQRIRPYQNSTIDEDQIFILRLNGAASASTAQQNIWCQARGIGERIPVRLISGQDRDIILKRFDLQQDAERTLTLACQQRLPSGVEMQVVFGKGVATPSGMANKIEKRFDFTVRDPFKATFSCERANANAPCSPLSDLTLSFNAAIPQKLAAAIVLKGSNGKIAPEEMSEDADASISDLRYRAPLPENAELLFELPKNFKDESGRPLINADRFPLKTRTGAMPPLAKFSAAPFGVVERFAEENSPPLLPVTLRNVEADLHIKGLAPQQLNTLKIKDDAAIIQWYKRVQRMHENSYTKLNLKRVLAGQESSYSDRDNTYIETRSVSLLNKEKTAKRLTIPQTAAKDSRPFEVVGIPMSEPGFHIVEIESLSLGKTLLGKSAPMYVRTSVLVTNLGVHFKQGRENALVWVTSLDKGKPVANAQVRISDCNGRELASGRTNKEGLALFDKTLPNSNYCTGMDGLFVSARVKDAKGVEDMAFTLSSWNRGIEAWRFDVPTDTSRQATVRTHSVLDRTLLRAGETVSMKHFIRTENSKGFALPKQTPSHITIEHLGSGTQYELPLHWRKTATGGLSADNSFQIPSSANLGVYEVRMPQSESNDYGYSSAQFRVEEFRLPVLEGKIALAGGSKAAPLVNTREAPLDVQINYVSGGAAGNLPVRVSALLRDKPIHFANYSSFSFLPAAKDEEDSEQRIVADKLPLTLDKNGAGQLAIKELPAVKSPKDLRLEASFSDPNGEVQTISNTTTLWPAAVIAGIQSDSWVSLSNKLQIKTVALDLNGKPLAKTPMEVRGKINITTTTRKRMVGGFYSYDSKTESKDLGKLCSGKSDDRGLLLCDIKLEEAGNIELTVSAKDGKGNQSSASTSVWITKQGELWFGGENHDRMDVLPEKTSYAPGETAKFQIRMPFRQATALVSIEREGIIETQIVEISGNDPTISLKIKPEWGPNVFVSVFAQRGRVHEVPWYSFFTWGWRQPMSWWKAYRGEGQEFIAPTAMVDLSKPAFKLGVAEIRVDNSEYRLNVAVTSDKESYPIRSKAKVKIKVTLPNGKPAAHGEVALAAVDQALLELMPNSTWNALESLLQRRSWGVETATAQMEIIGRRHYGKKAVAAGGGGGSAATRELLDTLLLWQPNVQLDANGEANIEVPLNDAITRFKIVAVADHGVSRFGTGSTSIRATQDLQIISGLPPLVREGDAFRAMITLRNTTQRAMKIEAKAAGSLDLNAQTVSVPAGEAREVAWTVTVPTTLGRNLSGVLEWDIQAKEQGGLGVGDRLKLTQKVVPAVPVTVRQATLIRLDGNLRYPVTQPADSLPGRGGLELALQPRLVDGLPAIRDWFIRYPFACLEQKTSKAVGLRDADLWQRVINQLPTYLDSDGLASYFPPRAGELQNGSDTLTAYLLSATDEAQKLGLDYRIPQAIREQMETALVNFVEGRITRNHWSPQKDLDARKLAALEALSRNKKVSARMLGSITLAPNQWPTSALIDWYAILLRTPNLPEQKNHLAEAEQILRSRLSYQGTRLNFSTEKDDYWWWLMVNSDVNAARLLSLVIDQPQWQDEVPRLVVGMIARQENGAWHTTNANLWGGLALERFSQKFEREPVSGQTSAALEVAKSAGKVDWNKVVSIPASEGKGPAVIGSSASLKNNTISLAWGDKPAPDTLIVNQVGSGKPWLTLQSTAAVALKQAVNSGYRIKKTITAIEQASAGQYTRGDTLRISLEIDAQSDMSWVVINDPIPAGSTLLGSGLGRDSEIATQGETREGWAWPAFEERSFESYRAYYQYIPKGKFKVEYTVRLNNAGQFGMPPTRIEAMYAPEVFGETPNAAMMVLGK